MEKLAYVLVDGADAIDGRVERLAAALLPVARPLGAKQMRILVPDEADAIRQANKMRIGGDFDRVAAAVECWLPSIDARGPIEAVLAAQADTLWGYLVTESTLDPCPHAVEDGERVPGVTQWGLNDKPEAVSMEDFHREWAHHSALSFGLHPHRDSYERNAIARALTPDAPRYLGLVLERFPSLDHFTDDALYFGDPAHTKRVIDHVPSFYDFASAITGGMSEYRWR